MCPDTDPINKVNSNADHINLARLVLLSVLLNPMARKGPINSIETLQDVTWNMFIMVVTVLVSQLPIGSLNVVGRLWVSTRENHHIIRHQCKDLSLLERRRESVAQNLVDGQSSSATDLEHIGLCNKRRPHNP